MSKRERDNMEPSRISPELKRKYSLTMDKTMENKEENTKPDKNEESNIDMASKDANLKQWCKAIYHKIANVEITTKELIKSNEFQCQEIVDLKQKNTELLETVQNLNRRVVYPDHQQ